MVTKPLDLTRTTLSAVLSIVGLIVVSFSCSLRPFLAATVWAATLVIATWPLMRRLQSAFGGRRWAAVTLMTLLLLFLVLIPLSMAISSIATHATRLVELPELTSAARIPSPPAWLSDVPLVGRPVAEKWKSLVESSTDDIIQLVRPYARSITEWFIAAAGSFGGTVLHLFLTIGIAAILYAKGELAADWCRLFGRRLADERGEEVVVRRGSDTRRRIRRYPETALAQTTSLPALP